MLRRIQPSHLLIVLPFVGIQFFLSLGDLGLVGPDEPRYAQVAREMLVSGDYVTPRYFGEPWLEKPVLYYWMTAAAYLLAGVNEFSARLPSAVSAVLGVFCVYLVGKRRDGPREGLLASLILAASLLYFSLARAASTDMPLSGVLAVSWTSLYLVLFGANGLWRGSDTQRASLGLLVLFYGSLGVATLAKGPAGFILPAASLVVFLAITGRLDLVRRLRPFTGLGVFLGVVLPWYGLCYQANGWLFIEEFLLRHNLERFFTDRYEHTQPFWFFPAVALIGFFPWSLQLFPSVRRLFQGRNQWRSPLGAQDLFLWSWFLTTLVLFSLSRSKLPGYLLPAAPAIALLIARQVELWLKREPAEDRRRWFKDVFFYQALSVFLLGLVLPVSAGQLNLPTQSVLLPATIGFVSTGLLALGLYWRDCRRGSVACYLLAIGLSVAFVTRVVYPQVDPSQSSRQLAAFLQREGFTGQPLFVFGVSRSVAYGLGFYLNSKASIVYSEGDMHYPPGDEAFFVTSSGFEPRGFFTRNEVGESMGFQSLRILRVRHRLE